MEDKEDDMKLFSRLYELCITMVKKFTPAKAAVDPNKKATKKK
jgi:hypothetical protein